MLLNTLYHYLIFTHYLFVFKWSIQLGGSSDLTFTYLFGNLSLIYYFGPFLIAQLWLGFEALISRNEF